MPRKRKVTKMNGKGFMDFVNKVAGGVKKGYNAVKKASDYLKDTKAISKGGQFLSGLNIPGVSAVAGRVGEAAAQQGYGRKRRRVRRRQTGGAIVGVVQGPTFRL